MKAYYNTNTIRLTGKVWEIRAKLRSWANLSLTVQDLLYQKGHSRSES